MLQTGPQWNAYSGCVTHPGQREHPDSSIYQSVGQIISVSAVGARTQRDGSDITEMYGGGPGEVGDRQLGHSDLCSTSFQPAVW